MHLVLALVLEDFENTFPDFDDCPRADAILHLDSQQDEGGCIYDAKLGGAYQFGNTMPA